MPYCPKCDMEFVEGITICSDCGGPLMASKEAALALQKEEKLKEEEWLAKAAEEAALFAGENQEEPAAVHRPPRVYVKKSEQFEDLKSSFWTFLMMGAVLTAVSILSLTGVLPLPFYGASGMITRTVLLAAGLGCLWVAASSARSAKTAQSQIQEEDDKRLTAQTWFLENWTAEKIDAVLARDFSGLAPEELALKRMELIADLLVTNQDLADASFADALAEELYARLYEDQA